MPVLRRLDVLLLSPLLAGAAACGDTADRTDGDAEGARAEQLAPTDSARRALATPPWADSGLDPTRIRLDTVASMQTIRLTGTVRTEEEKARAGRLAAAHAPGYRVLNLVLVRPLSEE